MHMLTDEDTNKHKLQDGKHYMLQMLQIHPECTYICCNENTWSDGMLQVQRQCMHLSSVKRVIGTDHDLWNVCKMNNHWVCFSAGQQLPELVINLHCTRSTIMELLTA